MTERREEQRYDGDLPSDKLVRYKWALTGEDFREGPERAEALYSNAVMKLIGLVDAHGVVSVHDRSVILGGLVEGLSPYEVEAGSLSFDDWVTRLRLIPVRLLERELPPIEQYTPKYLCELFDTALPKNSAHSGTCLTFEYSGEACDKGEVCPARVVSRVCLKQLGLLLFDRHTFEPAVQIDELELAENNVKAMRYRLEHYGLFTKAALEAAAQDMDMMAKDLYAIIAEPKDPKHRNDG